MMRGSYQREYSSVGTSGSILVEYSHTRTQPLNKVVSDYHMYMSDTSHSHMQSLIFNFTPFTLTPSPHLILSPSPHPHTLILSPSPHPHTSFSHPHPHPLTSSSHPHPISSPHSLTLTPSPHLILSPSPHPHTSSSHPHPIPTPHPLTLTPSPHPSLLVSCIPQCCLPGQHCSRACV